MIIEIPDDFFDEESKENTPARYAAFWKEWQALSDESKLKFTTFKNEGFNQMVILKDIEFASICTHHTLPFHGHAHIGYIPKDKICGVSKLARVVDMFASRPQLQERMTQQIADYLWENLDPQGVIVIVEGAHDCMRIRGVKKQESVMITSAMKGSFEKNKASRDEFLALIGKKA